MTVLPGGGRIDEVRARRRVQAAAHQIIVPCPAARKLTFGRLVRAGGAHAAKAGVARPGKERQADERKQQRPTTVYHHGRAPPYAHSMVSLTSVWTPLVWPSVVGSAYGPPAGGGVYLLRGAWTYRAPHHTSRGRTCTSDPRNLEAPRSRYAPLLISADRRASAWPPEGEHGGEPLGG